MLPVSVQHFYAAATDMQKIRAIVERHAEQYPPEQLVAAAEAKAILPVLDALNAELMKFDCRAAMATIRRVKAHLDSGSLTYGSLIFAVNEMDGRIRDELETCYAFALTAQEAAIYDPTDTPQRVKFLQQFESAAYDLEECAKCMALGRSTAAVFHAMRILERGIAAIAACLGIPDPVRPAERNWGKMLERIDEAIKAKWPTVASRETGDGHLFESLYAMLVAIKNPWRNKAMHPARKYTVEEAARIIMASASFMEELSDRCNEKGEPKA